MNDPIARPYTGSSTPSSCRHLLRYGIIAAAVLAVSAPVPARAVDKFEIQVYEPDVNDPGQFGLEAHINYTPRGRRMPEYSGEVPPDRVGRLTFEPALGVTRWFELGAYFQTMLEPDGRVSYAGFKLRGKFVLPRQPAPWFFGVNVENRKCAPCGRAGWLGQRVSAHRRLLRWALAVRHQSNLRVRALGTRQAQTRTSSLPEKSPTTPNSGSGSASNTTRASAGWTAASCRSAARTTWSSPPSI